MSLSSKPKSLKFNVSLAQRYDAIEIAHLSRDLIEHGLRWRYKPRRVLRLIHKRGTNVAVAKKFGVLAGFGIMTYYEERANLDLLAVKPEFSRAGVGTEIVAWLELVAVTSGIEWLDVQVRETNSPAIAFYNELGFMSKDVVERRYDGIEDSIRMSKNLYNTRLHLNQKTQSNS